jgi:hypothetical protein
MHLDKDTGAKSRHKNTRPAHDLSAYAGAYQHLAYGRISITDESGALHWSWRGMRATMALPAAERARSSRSAWMRRATRPGAADCTLPGTRRAATVSPGWLRSQRAARKVAAPDAASRAGTGKTSRWRGAPDRGHVGLRARKSRTFPEATAPAYRSSGQGVHDRDQIRLALEADAGQLGHDDVTVVDAHAVRKAAIGLE